MRDFVRYLFGFAVCGLILTGAAFWQNWHKAHPHPVHATALIETVSSSA